MSIWEALISILLSTIKPVSTPIGLIILDTYSVGEIAFVCSLGCVIGTVSFYLVGSLIFNKLNKYRKRTSINYKKNRRFLKIRDRFGLIGMSLSIGLISVPLGAFIVAKYYPKDKRAIPYLVLSSVLWVYSVSYLGFYFRSLFVSS